MPLFILESVIPVKTSVVDPEATASPGADKDGLSGVEIATIIAVPCSTIFITGIILVLWYSRKRKITENGLLRVWTSTFFRPQVYLMESIVIALVCPSVGLSVGPLVCWFVLSLNISETIH